MASVCCRPGPKVGEHQSGESHVGFVANGIEDTESEAVRAWAPAYENYTFSSVPEGTRLVIDQDVTADFEEFMREAWPKAFALLMELCEEKSAT